MKGTSSSTPTAKQCTQSPIAMNFPSNQLYGFPVARETLYYSWPRDASLLTSMTTPGNMSSPANSRRVTFTMPSPWLSLPHVRSFRHPGSFVKSNIWYWILTVIVLIVTVLDCKFFFRAPTPVNVFVSVYVLCRDPSVEIDIDLTQGHPGCSPGQGWGATRGRGRRRWRRGRRRRC